VKQSQRVQCTLYHNPRCSKSRAALALLRENGIEPRVVDYLTAPPTAEELKALLVKLRLEPQQLLRTGEEPYRERFANQTLTDAQCIAAMVAYPVLMERPIAVVGERAVIGRPLETVLQLLRDD
jgi:arsenate reductase (glutaredoxin)